MAYAERNFKTKKQLKEAVANGDKVYVFQPGPFPLNTSRGRVALESPHYPAAHTWYADCDIAVDEDGEAYVTKVR